MHYNAMTASNRWIIIVMSIWCDSIESFAILVGLYAVNFGGFQHRLTFSILSVLFRFCFASFFFFICLIHSAHASQETFDTNRKSLQITLYLQFQRLFHINLHELFNKKSHKRYISINDSKTVRINLARLTSKSRFVCSLFRFLVCFVFVDLSFHNFFFKFRRLNTMAHCTEFNDWCLEFKLISMEKNRLIGTYWFEKRKKQTQFRTQ